MTKANCRQLLPYIGIPILELMLWRFQRETDPAVLLLNSALLALSYLSALVDLREKRIPNQLVAVMLGIWVLILIPQIFYRTEYAIWLFVNGCIGFLLGEVVFLLVYLVSRKGLGGGDVKFIAASGLYLGVDILPAMLYGSILSAIVGIGLLLTKKIGLRDSIPLAPFLCAGMLVVMFTQS